MASNSPNDVPAGQSIHLYYMTTYLIISSISYVIYILLFK